MLFINVIAIIIGINGIVHVWLVIAIVVLRLLPGEVPQVLREDVGGWIELAGALGHGPGRGFVGAEQRVPVVPRATLDLS